MASRTTRSPWCGYKSPITGRMVLFQETEDAEILLMNERELAGDHVVGITRIRELAEQSAQNRARIAKRVMGESDPKPESRERRQLAAEEYRHDRGNGQYADPGDCVPAEDDR